jgi:hypothetical protein
MSWCALIVLMAVCSLTVSVATRYSTPSTGQSPTVKTLRTQVSPEGLRQRLAQDAVTWMPPVVLLSVLEAPSFYPRTAPAGPPVPSLLLEESLYNRPPPSFHLHS